LLRVAFVGFRHGHIFSLYDHVKAHPQTSIVAACEEDPLAREHAEQRGIAITHVSYDQMLAGVECDVVACGDYYGIRGARIIAALEKGRHVISDKPLCTSLDELEAIARLSRDRNRVVGCMLDLGASGSLRRLQHWVAEGRLGEVHSVVFMGQHPLLYGKRADWYFEPGKHGGTINDIGIHAIDLLPSLTGRTIVEITAARSWNAKCLQHPYFHDGAAFALRLDNNGSVLGDVSYLSSDKHGYSMPTYWRFTLSGSEGVAEASCTQPHVYFWEHFSSEVWVEPALPTTPAAYLEDFIAEVEGTPNTQGLTTMRVLQSTRIALMTQRAGETGEFPVRI